VAKSHTMPARELPLDDTWDVIVAGGGPSGCTAATAAAREGARTLLIEAAGALGGMGTLGLVPAWCPFSDGEKMIYRGLAEKVFRAAAAGVPHEPTDKLDWVAINPELLKRIYDELVTGAGAEVLFHTALAAVEADGRDVRTLIVANKAGLSALRAKVYVDCTGDADLAVWAGAQWAKGDEAGGLQPATHCFILSNVDGEAYRAGPRLRGVWECEPAAAMARDEELPLIQDVHFCNSLIGPNTVGFNAGHLWDVDNTDPVNLSRGLITGRQLAVQMRDGLAKYIPDAFGEAFLVTTGPLLGIRETRRIVGDYVLTVDDYRARRSFPDEICRNAYYIDVHLSAEEARRRAAGKLDMGKRKEHYGPGQSHGVPYRCLIPRALDNVLVAGRSISTDRIVQGSTRVMPVCLAMGEAAGLAAAMAVASADVRSVDTDRLRTRLTEYGAYLPDVANSS